MKELLGLVGFGPEETEEAKPVERKPEPKPVTPERPKVQEQPKAPERPVVSEAPKATPERPAVQERPVAQERPVVQERPTVQERPVVQQPKIEREPAVERREPVARPVTPAYDEPVVERKEAPRKEASTSDWGGFFSFGKPKAKQPTREPVYEEPVYTPPVRESAPIAEEYTPMEEEPIRPPFIRPGATVIAAGATFFGDIRAEGDVEVLGKVKGNLEATGNIRVVGKVLGDVKGEAVVLEGCTVQGNITSTSFVTLDAGAMVVGDVLATDFDSDGKVKGNLQIARAATFSSCALLAGNVIAATIMMAQGAKVQGAVRIAEDPEANALFGELEI